MFVALALTVAVASPARASVPDMLALMGHYSVIVLDDLSTTSDVEGRTFVGDDVVSGASANFAIQMSAPASDGTLVVVDDIVAGNSLNLNAGSLRIGGTTNGRNINYNGGGSLIPDPSLSVEPTATQLKNASLTIAGYASNNTVTIPSPQPGALRFTVSNTNACGVAIFDIPASVFSNSNVQQIELDPGSASTIVINVSGNSVNWNQGNMVSQFTNTTWRARVLWNFHQATSINFNSRNMMGAVLAPLANVNTTANIDGSIAANSLTTSSEVHFPAFAGDPQCGPTPTPTPTPVVTPTPTPVVTPTPTPVVTPTPTPVVTPTPTPVVTPTPTPVVTPTPTPVVTPTPTPVVTPTPTPVVTPTPTPVVTPTPTPVVTPTPTAVVTPTPTPVVTPTPTPVVTPTPTPVVTPTPTPVVTPTPTPVVTPTSTPTATPTATPTLTPTPLPTGTAIVPPTPTPAMPPGVCHHACPDTLKFGRGNNQDQLIIRSAFSVDTVVDPSNEAFEIVLSNANGVIYQGQLQPGDLVRKGKKFQFIDRSARKTPGLRDGLFKVEVSPAQADVGTRITIQAYGDFAAAALAEMTIKISLGEDAVQRTDAWLPRAYGWLNAHR